MMCPTAFQRQSLQPILGSHHNDAHNGIAAKKLGRQGLSLRQGQRLAHAQQMLLNNSIVPLSHQAAADILHTTDLRRNVGICVCNRHGLVFAARRLDDTEGSWQMPQGGIAPPENPLMAARRELLEETGMHSVTFLAQIDQWLDYEFPTTVRDTLPWTRYRGQTQKWTLYRFDGEESQIDLELHGKREFSEYCWMPIEELPRNVVSFKRPVYEQVAKHFAPIIQRLPCILEASG